jgi:hypothetical protein
MGTQWLPRSPWPPWETGPKQPIVRKRTVPPAAHWITRGISEATPRTPEPLNLHTNVIQGMTLNTPWKELPQPQSSFIPRPLSRLRGFTTRQSSNTECLQPAVKGGFTGIHCGSGAVCGVGVVQHVYKNHSLVE